MEEPMVAPMEVELYEPDPWELARLRELRAEVQDLQAVLESIRKGETTLKVYAGYIEKTKNDIAELMQDIGQREIVHRLRNSIRHLYNILEQMNVSPLLIDPEGEFDAQEQLHHLNTLDAQCRQLVYTVGVLTIPSRLNRWLASARPGYYIPFHSVFDDELPDLEDRVRVLNYLAWSPKVIKGGLVDAANGLVYRYARSPRARLASFLLLVAAFGLAMGIVIGACYLPIEGWPIEPKHLPTFLVGWGAVLAGVIVHLGVGSVKRTQAQGGRPPIIAIGDLPLLINAKVGQILLKLLLTLVGFFGFVFTAGVDNVTPLNTLLVGYSLDSVVDMFGVSLEQQAAAQVATLKQQLGVRTGQ